MTERRYDSIIRTYLRPEFGSRKVGAITHEVVQRWINRLAADERLAPGTVRNAYAVLRTAMSYAVRIGVAKVNPCMSIDLPRARRAETRRVGGDVDEDPIVRIDGLGYGSNLLGR